MMLQQQAQVPLQLLALLLRKLRCVRIDRWNGIEKKHTRGVLNSKSFKFAVVG